MKHEACTHCKEFPQNDTKFVSSPYFPGAVFHKTCIREHANLGAMRLLEQKGFTHEETLALQKTPASDAITQLREQGFSIPEIHGVLAGLYPEIYFK